MNKKSIRALSAFITVAMLASAVPSVSAEDVPDTDEAVVAAENVTEADGQTADETAADTEDSATVEATETETSRISVAQADNAEEMSDEEKIDYALGQLELLNFSEKKPKVTTIGLHLPTSIQIGKADSVAVNWTSGDEEWMTSDGTLLMQPEHDSHIITMTAELTSGDAAVTKTFEIAIKAYEEVKAFPGAQGGGTQTRGGAYGYVYHVTTLAADGPGSFKEAVEGKSGARTIVFDVGGTIDLTPVGRALALKGEAGSNVTIAGQTAPGEGIQLKGYGLNMSNVHDVIVRNISIRIGNVRKAGDKYQSDPMSVSGNNKRVVIDHVSMCWGVDMGFRVDGSEITMSNCMITKGLYWNTPHEKGKHNYAGMFRAKYGTFYGNYIADCGQRAPRIIDNEYIDVRNNVVANSKYSFDICNYEWMGANPKFNIVNNAVLMGNPAPGGSASNVTSAGSYKYFQGRAYSGGLFTYSKNNYDNTSGGRAIDGRDREIAGLWQGQLKSGSAEEKVVGNEMGAFSPTGYSNIAGEYRDLIFPGDMSLTDYNNSLVSKQGNTLMPYPFVSAPVKTYSSEDAVKYVLENVGSRGRVNGDILTRRYTAEGRTRLKILADYLKGAKCYGIELPEGYEGDTAYGLPVHTQTRYIDSNGMELYDIDGNTVTDPSEYNEAPEVIKYVTMADESSHLASLYAISTKNEKFMVRIRDYNDSDGIYDGFDVYDINNKKLDKPENYASTKSDEKGMVWAKGISLLWCDWGDGAGNYDHKSDTVTDGNLGTEIIDTEWNRYDWPQLPTVYRDSKNWDSNGDGIPDFYVELMGWPSGDEDISREDFEGRGYTNLEYYINDCCAGDQEPVDDINDDPVEAENVRDGSSKFDTHNSHEILFNTVKRAKAKIYVCEGDYNEETAKEIPLNTYYDYDVNDEDIVKHKQDTSKKKGEWWPLQSKYRTVEDFDTYFSYVFTALKPDTTYSYKIKTYNDQGIETMSEAVYSFKTRAASTGKPLAPRVKKYIPFDSQITLDFEPGSEDKGYRQESYAYNKNKTYKLTYITNNKFDTKTDHYVIRYSKNADMSDSKEITVPSSVTNYVIKGLENNTKYYVDLRAVSADGTESDPAVYSSKTIQKTGTVDKDGNDVYSVRKIEIKDEKFVDETPNDDVNISTIAIEPTKYAVNVDYAKALKENGIVEGATTMFTTIFSDVYDWYIYTLGGIPIPTTPKDGDSPILMLRDESHDHGFTYAKTFDTPLSGKSTIRCKLMIKNEVLDGMNQSPELRFYLQQDSADSDNAGGDEGEGVVDSGTASDAAVFGNIVSLSFTKNDINYNGAAIQRYTTDTWYDIKLLLNGDEGTCDVYINDKLVRAGLEYSDSATSNTIARWQLGSRLAGTEDVYVQYMYAYSGWEDPMENADPDATQAPDNTVKPGTSGSRPSGGGGGGGGGSVSKPTEAPSETPTETPSGEPTGTPAATAAPTAVPSRGFADMKNYEWAEEPVAALSARGIVNGVSDTEFAPAKNITRAEFTTMLMRGFNLIDDTAECSFGDVNENDWYYDAVASAYKLGVVNGISDTEFGSDSLISRQDMAVMITRLLDKLETKLEKTKDYEKFADDAAIADYAKTAVTALCEAGIIDGVGDNKFEPTGTANRAAAAKVLYGVLSPQWTDNGEE